MTLPTLIYVELKKSTRPWSTKRAQKWSWTASNGGNNRVLARSSEHYTNKADALAAIQALFGNTSNVFLGRHDNDKTVLRLHAVASVGAFRKGHEGREVE